MQLDKKNHVSELEIIIAPGEPEWLNVIRELNQEPSAPSPRRLNLFTAKSSECLESSSLVLMWTAIGLVSGFVTLLVGDLILKTKQFSFEEEQNSFYSTMLGCAISYFTFEFLKQNLKQFFPNGDRRIFNIRDLLLRNLILNNIGVLLGHLMYEEAAQMKTISADITATCVGAGLGVAALATVKELRSGLARQS